MLVRHPADYRTLFWTLVLVPAVGVAQMLRPDLGWYLFPLSMYLAVSCAVIAHNHMHRPTMQGKLANHLFSNWISIAYGYPVFAWMPTHNLNHHRYVNKHGDATITWRYTNRHNALVAGTYFFVSAYHQGRWIKDFIRQAKEKNSPMYRRIITQYVVTYGAHLGIFLLAVSLYGAKLGSLVYVRGFFVPAFFALWTVMLFNYSQHVHTDPWSKRNHSRNFTGALLNFLLFGNGYHTVHHDDANLHWSEAKAAHEKIASEIDPRLCHRSMWWFFFRQHVLALFFPSLGTVQVGRPPWEAPPEQKRADAPEEHAFEPLGAVGVGGQI
jgi:beta-carotene hydroxylase